MARVIRTQRKPATEARASSSDRAGEIARVAYELFLKRGGAHGCDQDDWFQAERIVWQRSRGRAAA